MPYTDNTFPTDPVGSGDPYQGTGFTNFDRYLQEQNVQWGAEQPKLFEQGQAYDTNPAFDNWMINASGQAGFPKPPAPVTPPVTPTAPVDNTPPEQPEYVDPNDTLLGQHVDRAHENDPNWTGMDPTPRKPPGNSTTHKADGSTEFYSGGKLTSKTDPWPNLSGVLGGTGTAPTGGQNIGTNPNDNANPRKPNGDPGIW